MAPLQSNAHDLGAMPYDRRRMNGHAARDFSAACAIDANSRPHAHPSIRSPCAIRN